jgi:hypothetical protein
MKMKELSQDQIMNATGRELDALVAEWMGWINPRGSARGLIGNPPGGTKPSKPECVPLYHHDANAIREVLAEIELRGLFDDYFYNLAVLVFGAGNVAGKDSFSDPGCVWAFTSEDNRKLYTADLETICRAALLTAEKGDSQ